MGLNHLHGKQMDLISRNDLWKRLSNDTNNVLELLILVTDVQSLLKL